MGEVVDDFYGVGGGGRAEDEDHEGDHGGVCGFVGCTPGVWVLLQGEGSEEGQGYGGECS